MDLIPPLGVFSSGEFVTFAGGENPLIYVPYAVHELDLEAAPAHPCNLLVGPPPTLDQGVVLAGETAFWQSYDYETETAMLWQYDPTDTHIVKGEPGHLPLLFTQIEVASSFSGLISFVVSADARQIAWSRTTPIYDDASSGYVYQQEVWVAGIPSFDVLKVIDRSVPEIDGLPRIIRLRALSQVSNTLYFSEEPVGLGATWPRPYGKYTNLYAIPTEGGTPEVIYECITDHWCISDFSEQHDLIAYVEDSTLYLAALDGGPVATLAPEIPFDHVGQASIGPQGDVVFIVVTGEVSGLYSQLDAEVFGDHAAPNQVYVYHLPSPYHEPPRVLLSDPGIRYILGWAAQDRVLTQHVVGLDDSGGAQTADRFYLADLGDATGYYLPFEPRDFERLLP